MALKKTVDLYQFVDAFAQAGRKEDFSRLALENLHEYYEELSDSIGEDIDFDVISICCEWTEYDTLEGLKQDYEIDAPNFAEAADIWESLHGVYEVNRVLSGSEIHSLLIPAY